MQRNAVALVVLRRSLAVVVVPESHCLEYLKQVISDL